MGSGRYLHLPPEEQLASVPSDIREVSALFGSFGYVPVLVGLGEYDGAEQLRQKLRHWSADTALTGEDVVVVYFAGHGAVEERDRHYLLCWDSQDANLAATALATEDLVRTLCKGGLRHLLLILDTCSAGAGSADASAVALQTIVYRGAAADTSAGLWFLASARRKDVADDGAFVAALGTAIDTTTERTGQRQQYLDLTELVKAVNERFEAEGRGQRAELASGLVTGLAPFLANVGYREELPPLGTDLEVQRRVVARDLSEHFGPRSRGVEFESEQGLYFSGRVTVLSELVGWLTASDGDGRGRVVTGSPGCGKSAVLGRIVALSDPAYRARLDLTGGDPRTVVPERCVTAAVHARHKRLEEVVDRIAAALGTEADGAAALLQELTRRGRQGPPLIIVVDAVDEAGSDTAADAGGHGEPRRITRELLRPMSEIQGVRLLVGTRHELVTPLGPTFVCMDLDREEYRAGREDVTGYVARVLLAAEEADVRTPYRGRPELARAVARGVADKAAGVYLYARTTARTLRSDETAVDITKPGWAEALPSEVGEAFDDYLARFGPDEPRVRRMLLALAFSEGKGLPRGRVWTALSSVISGVPCEEQDVSWLLDVAEAYIAEVVDDDRRSVYRLYHKALAEHLRATADRPPAEIQQSVVDALRSLVPGAAEGHPDWFAAVAYVRQHLATHAAEAGRLAELVEDPGFLLACEPLSLLRAFAAIEGEGARRVRGAYEQVAHRLTADRPLGERAADLQLSARRCGADRLADRVEELAVIRPWSARWAWWSTSGVHRLLAGHARTVACVAVGLLDGRPIAVTGSMDRTARVWDLQAQRQIGDPLPVGIAVSAIAIGELGDYTVALTGGDDGVVRIWDLSAGQEYGAPLTGHTNRVESIVVGAVRGHPVVLTASADGTARVWDLVERRQLGRDLSAHRRSVRAADLGELDGRPIAVTGGEDKAVHVWDLSGILDGGDARLDGSPLIGPAMAVTAVCATELDGRTVALVGDEAGMLSRWDLAERRQIGEPVMAHVHITRSGVFSASVGGLRGRPVALTSGTRSARLWDLRTLQPLAHQLRGHVEDIRAAALAHHGEAAFAVTVGDDRTARIWDLTADQPPEGHTQPVSAIAFCAGPGRPLAVTGSEDGTARVWDLHTRDQLGAPMEGHTGQVTAVACEMVHVRPRVATGGSDTTVRLWDPLRGPGGDLVLAGHTNAVRCLAFGELDGRSVVVSGSEDGTARVWDAASGTPVGVPLAGHVGGIRRLAVRRAGRGMEIVLSTSLGHAYLWQLTADGAAPAARRAAHFEVMDLTLSARIVGVGFHHSRAVVLASLAGNNVHVHDVADGKLLAGPFRGHTGFVMAGTLGQMGGEPVLATSGLDNAVRIWNVETGAPFGPPLEVFCSRGPLGADTPPVFGHSGGLPVVITAGSLDVRVWDLAALHPIGEPLCGVEQTLVSADIVAGEHGRDLVVTGGLDGAVRVHDLADGRQVAPQFTFDTLALSHVTADRPGGNTVVVRSSWMYTDVWTLEPRRRLVKRPGTSLRAATYALGDRRIVVSVSGDFALHAWDLETQSPLGVPMTGHTSIITGLRTGLVGGTHTVASSSYDGTVRLWDLETGRPLAEPLGGHELGATGLELARAAGEDLVVTGSGDGSLRVHTYQGGWRLRTELPPFSAVVGAIRVIDVRGVATLIAADQHGLMRVWDLARPGSWTTEIHIGSGINGFTVDHAGRVCVATDMGVVALSLTEVRP
ncbi:MULTISPECIES: caspase family protein [unclassified Streptomyces]|uniref:caspase family protein n=1 Tax=unclassified Streptomyces TaxID=2593676 RepID=UPI002E1542F1|nr:MULTISPECIES: caspase family protein [unclassified Streptomyces]WSR24697.1 caspase family protein [Streptomyces sp. NBC_01205]